MNSIFKGMRYQEDIILLCVVFYLKYPLSTKNLEEILTLRNLSIDHSTINRWVIKYSGIIEKNYRKRSLQFS